MPERLDALLRHILKPVMCRIRTADRAPTESTTAL
jgi:hypothetical protein